MLLVGLCSSVILGLRYKREFFAFTVFFILEIAQMIISNYSVSIGSYIMKAAMIYFCVVAITFVKKGIFE